MAPTWLISLRALAPFYQQSINRHGSYQRSAYHHELGVGRHTDDDQGVTQKTDEEHTEQDADHAALASKERHTAQNNGRHRVQLHSTAQIRLPGGDSSGENDGDQRAPARARRPA